MVASVAVGAVTVLPVLMGAFARRLRPTRARARAPSPRFARWGRAVVRRPWRATIAGRSCCSCSPPRSPRCASGSPTTATTAPGSTTRPAYDRLAEGFGPGFNGPLVLAAACPRAATAALRASAPRSPPTRRRRCHAGALNPAGDAATLTVIPATSPQDERTSQLVERLRDTSSPRPRGHGLAVHVGGATATFEDLADKIASRLPIFIALVIGRA